MRDRLYRSRQERVLFGVAGGVADWLDVDPALVRIVFALLVFAGGIGFFLYLVMAIVVPEEPGYVSGPAMPTGSDAPPATEPGPPSATPAGAAWVDERAERRAARRARRAEDGGRGVVIFGAILIIVGAWFLLRKAVPALDADLLGPIVLIVIGALLLAGALSRGGSGSGTPPPQG
jgi:phage shock protein PspC (stress-responsive transcriptional regulator)